MDMKNLLISGNTGELSEWDIQDTLHTKSKDQQIEQMLQYDWDNKTSRSGWTYLEIEQFNNTYNNFR